MSPVTPRCALPVTDPRSTPGGVLPREPRRRGVIRIGALGRIVIRRDRADVPTRKDGILGGSVPIPARGDCGGVESRHAAFRLILASGKTLYADGHEVSRHGHMGSRSRARPVDFTPCQHLPLETFPGRV